MDGFLLSLYAAAGGFTTSNRLSPGRRSQDFDPCSLCGERRTRGGKGIIKDTFQFTLSLRRATVLLSSPPVMWQRFQSTLSLRRATVGGCRYFCIIKNFNPRSPHGERLVRPDKANLVQHISIHALLAESDNDEAASGGYDEISIHALLAESDLLQCCCLLHQNISIHALLAESDPESGSQLAKTEHFNPRSPCGERPAPQWKRWPSRLISIHALLAESDDPSELGVGELLNISIHALLAESDAFKYISAIPVSGISIHALLAESDSKYHQIGPIVSV